MPRSRTGNRKPPKNPKLKWRGDILWCDTSLTIGGKEFRIRRSSRTDDEKLAEEWLARLEERIYREKQFKEKPDMPIEEALVRYWLEYGSKRRSTAIAPRLRHYKEFFMHLKGLQYISQIDDGAVAEYVRWRRDTACRNSGTKEKGHYIKGKRTSDSTIRKDVYTLHHMIMHHAADFWNVKIGHIQARLHSKHLTVPRSMATALDQREVALLLNCLPTFLRLPIEFSVLTGLRKGNVWNLRTSQIDWAAKKIVFLVKTPRPDPKILELPLIGRMQEILYEAGVVEGMEEDRLVFLQEDGAPLGDHRKATDTAFRQAGIKRKHFQRYHLLRHTAATQIYEQTRDALVVKEILGHANLSTTMIYTHLVEEKKRAALEVHSSSQIRHTDKEEG